MTVGSAALTQTYLDDRSKVWELLSALTRHLECWSYVNPAKNKGWRKRFLQSKHVLS